MIQASYCTSLRQKRVFSIFAFFFAYNTSIPSKIAPAFSFLCSVLACTAGQSCYIAQAERGLEFFCLVQSCLQFRHSMGGKWNAVSTSWVTIWHVVKAPATVAFWSDLYCLWDTDRYDQLLDAKHYIKRRISHSLHMRSRRVLAVISGVRFGPRLSSCPVVSVWMPLANPYFLLLFANNQSWE